MGRAWLGWGTLAASAAVVVVAACREPTAITLEITTDVPCTDVVTGGGVDVRIGAASTVETSPSTHVQATTCDAGRIGTVTIVPSAGDDDQVGVFVAVASNANPSIAQGRSSDCNSDTPGNCVIARRILRFVPHASLRLPIHLGLACAGATCAPGETCDPSDGLCHASDACSRDPESCVVSNDAGSTPDATPSCPRCGGTTCIDLDVDPKNCGGCGLVCNGTCVGGACKLVATAVPTSAQGCIAVGESKAVWSTTGAGGAVSWVGTAGGANANLLATVAGFGNVSYGLGFSALSYPPLLSTSTDYAGTPLFLSGTPWTLAAPATHFWVARSKAGDRCATTQAANSGFVVACPPRGTSPSLGGKPGAMAVGKLRWAAILAPDSTESRVVLGDVATGATLGAVSAFPFARAIAAIPGSDSFFVAYDTKINAVGFDQTSNKVLSFPVFVGADPVRGVRPDGATIYFAEVPANGPSRIRKVTWTGGAALTSAAATPIASGSLTALGSVVCIDVDSNGVYYLADGMPYRRPK